MARPHLSSLAGVVALCGVFGGALGGVLGGVFGGVFGAAATSAGSAQALPSRPAAPKAGMPPRAAAREVSVGAGHAGAVHAPAANANAAPGPVLGTPAACTAGTGLPFGFGVQPRSGMVRVPAGRFAPGSVAGYPDERPVETVSLGAFFIDRTEVTVAQYAAFVRATGHVTQAERDGHGTVFVAPARGQAVAAGSWWRAVKGADWRHPEGPDADAAQPRDPVVQLARDDALAYARWLGRELPSESQWEWAARGGGRGEQLEREPRDPDDPRRAAANYWQGSFPDINTRDDGYAGRAPVGCFPANGYGLYDLIGNVWEWTRDAYDGPRQPHGSGDPDAATSRRASAAPAVIKGGSFLCAPDYCVRYRAAARHPQDPRLPTSHVGFRTVARDDG